MPQAFHFSGRFLAAALCLLAGRAAAATNDYAAVDAIFNTHCLECHGSKDPEGGLVLENFETLMKGGELGAAIAPGHRRVAGRSRIRRRLVAPECRHADQARKENAALHVSFSGMVAGRPPAPAP